MYEYSISVAEDVVLEDDARLVFVQSTSSSLAEATGYHPEEHDVEETGPGTYGGEGATCCSPSETVNLFAFVDLDRNGEWDAGEPWGEDPNNPVKIDADGYTSMIVIEPDAEG